MVTALLLPRLVGAGDLEPPGLPDSTMHTLDEIYNKLDQLAPGGGGLAPVEKTGQTTSYASGDDGNLRMGVAWPNPRFTDNGDGTVTDNLTELIWLKDAYCFGPETWQNALLSCNSLADGQCGLIDGSFEGDWRLPNAKELHSLIHFGYYSPALPDSIGTGQWAPDDPFTNVQSGYYWTSTTDVYYTGYAWYVALISGNVGHATKTTNYCVWPVRDGQ